MTAPRPSPAELDARALLQEVREAREELATAERALQSILALQERSGRWMHRESMRVRVLVAARTYARDLWRHEAARAEAEASHAGLADSL